MGLAIEVGYLADMLENDENGAAWFREELAKLNSLLSDHGLAAHREPEAMEVFSAEMHGYSGIHHLRRIAAHLSLNGGLPEPGDVNAAKDPDWDASIARVQAAYPDARLVLPGHGDAGGPELLAHTRRLATAAATKAKTE